eukprot:COSAG05_NODE_9750_length_603_cov_7.690476_1_plen_61_part_10
MPVFHSLCDTLKLKCHRAGAVRGVADAELAVGARALLDQVHPDSRLSPGAERLLVRTAKRL